MSTEKKNKILPNLRFAAFKNDAEWKLEALGELYSFKPTNSFSRDDLNYEDGTVKNIHYGDIHTKFSTLFAIGKERVPFINSSIAIDNISQESYCIEGDIIFADASEDLKDVGKNIEIINLKNEKLLSGMHTILARQKEPKLVVGFGGHLFMTDGIRTQIQRESQGTKVLGISGTRISSVKIYYPKNKIEQKKIADCLSSLDDLITAHNEKLEALQAHKKGLMQQLFPIEGETVPKRRFLGYSHEWEEKTLSQVADYENGKAHEQDISAEGDFIVVNSKFISTDGEVKKYSNTPYCIANKNDILMVLSDVPNGRAIAKCFFVDTDNLYTVNQRICKLTPIDANGNFLYYVLNRNSYFLSFDDGVKQTNLKKEEVLNCLMLLPKDPEEQQKISDCIFSLDELITEQVKKIEALQKHKKGLMQGLFPKINE